MTISLSDLFTTVSIPLVFNIEEAEEEEIEDFSGVQINDEILDENFIPVSELISSENWFNGGPKLSDE